jgi:1,4-dihydroxy-2-naphthoate octaprenyltransferase
MIFRILAVVVWSVMTVTVSTAASFLESGRLDWLNYLLTLAIASTVQGFPAHIVNEIVDWQTGADRFRKLGEKSGGSKVLKAGLATVPQLWWMFGVTSLIGFILIVLLCFRTGPAVFAFFVAGYFICLFYTMPPLMFAYRPFAGEWLGGFPGVVLNVTGTYYVQTGSISAQAMLLAAWIGLVYMSIMVLFHYLDYEGDCQARPMKRTTIVFLGLRRSKRYVLVLLLLAGVLSTAQAWKSPPLYWLMPLSVAVYGIIHLRCDPSSAESVVRQGRLLTYAVIVFSLAISVMAEPRFAVAGLMALAAFYLHKKFGKLRNLKPAKEPS